MRHCLFVVALAMLAFGASAQTVPSVLQRGYDVSVSGANLAESKLNTSNVAPSTFGLVFKLPVDESVYTQPLYVPGVAISGQGTHNVVYVTTMNDSLYAFDADTGAQLWSVNFASSVGAVAPSYAKFAFAGNRNVVGNLGILSTPVIDPSTNILYLVACTLENNTMVYRLHAVNITNGTEPYPNVVISGSYNGVTFDAPHQTQRVSLALSGNQVVFAFAAMEEEGSDVGGYAGWVMAYNKATLAQSGAFATVSTGTLGGGVWQSGRPPVVDSSGYVYVFVGNGYVAGYDGVHDFSESVLKLNPANGLKLVDWFTPSNWSALDSVDDDTSSSGPMLIPGTSLIAGGSKAGVLYILNTANLGKESAGDSGVVQEEAITPGEIRGGAVFWQRSSANGGPLLYNWSDSDLLKAYPFNGTQIAASPSSQGSISPVWPGGILAVSANGDTAGSGVLWATLATSGDAENNPPVPGALYAFDANNVATELWDSTMNAARDGFGNFAKFVPPLVVNGRVYVATASNQVAVYGLLGSGGGGGSSVSLAAVADVDGIASNGTAPVNGGWDDSGYAYSANLLGSSITYGGSTFTFGTEGANDAVSSTTIPLPVGNYTTLNLLGGAAHGAQTNQSFVVTYTDGTTTTITQSLSDWWGPPQNFAGESQVSKMAYLVTPTGATQNEVVYLYGYSLAINSAKTVESLTLPANRNVIILAVDVTGSGGGTPVAATPTFSPAPGSYAGAQSVTLSDTTPGAVIYYTTNSTAPTLSSAQFIPGTPIAVSTTETIEAMAVASGYTNSAVASGSYVIGSSGGGSSSVSLAAVADVDGIASNGTAPVDGGWDNSGYAYSANLLGSSITYGGSTFTFGTEGANDAVSSTTIPLPAGNYTTLNLLGGAAHGAQTNQSFVVTYTDGTTTTITQSLSDWWGPPQNFAGESQVSKMAYLVTPTGATQNTTVYLYGYSLAINSAKTVKSLTLPANRNVIILAVDVTGSGGGTPVAATPTFSLAPGSYAGAQSVTLSDTTPGAVIYYTTNSTAPTLSSAQFIPGTPIAVSTTETIEAMAVASGYTNSAVASGSYVISSGGGGGGGSSVSLATVADVDGIASNGTAPIDGGWDNTGDAYSANLLGSSITYGGSTFTFGTEGANDAVSSTTIPLPAGNYTTLNLLGGAAHGAQTNQSFVVTYTDGTTTTITQSLSDWWGPPQNFAGESQVSKMAYLVTPTGATQNTTVYLYGYSLAINSAKTVKSLTLPANRNVIILAVDVTGSGGGGSSSVNLAAVADVDGIASNGTAPIDGGWDDTGDAYSANLLGSSITYGGSTFTFGTEGANDAVSSTTIPLPAGNYTTLNLLGGAAHGAQTNQSFVVTYTDGTTTTITQSLSDWWGPPQNFAGESQVSKMAYLVTPTGATQNTTVYLYGYSLAINSAKTVKSLTLPANRNVIILAVDEVQ